VEVGDRFGVVAGERGDRGRGGQVRLEQRAQPVRGVRGGRCAPGAVACRKDMRIDPDEQAAGEQRGLGAAQPRERGIRTRAGRGEAVEVGEISLRRAGR
jgi:hypothetical protein